MRHEISEADRRKVEVALRKIGEVIKAEYPDTETTREGAFQWGVGDGFALALRGVVDAALPGWEVRE